MEDPLFVDLREQEDLEVQRIREDFSQRVQAARDTRALIISVYRAAWGDFYRDEAEACLSRINEIATPFPTWPLSSSGDLSANAFGEVEDGMILGEVDHDEDSYIISDFEEAVRADVICTGYAASAFSAHAKYEACTPATRSIKTDDRSHVLQFVQYAGEQDFDDRAYISEFACLAWQHGWSDTDGECCAHAYQGLVELHAYHVQLH